MSIYLDSAATTKPRQEVIDAMMSYFTNMWYNPSSLYHPSINVKNDIENARKKVGNFIGANGNEIYFTSCGSESNCWAIQGFINNQEKQHCIITSTIEHKSIIECIKNNFKNASIEFINVDKYGFVDIEQLKSILSIKGRAGISGKEILVSIQFANNEIGVIQHIKEISEVVHSYGAIFHTDSVQAFGHVPIDVKELGIDMMSCSGHKIGAPKGIGLLYKKNGIDISPLIYGSQMDGFRGGTENVAYIIGMAKAVELCDVNNKIIEKLCDKRNYFIDKLVEKFGCKVNGSLNERLPNNINVTFKQNMTAESLLYMLDIDDVYIGVGSACNSRSMSPSHVLTAIGLAKEESMRTVRFTLPDDITYKQIDNVIVKISKCLKIIEITN